MPEILGNSFVEFMLSFVNMLIALWMIPVMVAGQLLTNTFVYGEFLGFDKTLWHMWNISKIFANYIIGFIFIGSIFRYFFSTKEGDFNVIKSILPKIVLASLVVNMSWFILGFLIDLSTLMIATLGNLPSVFIDENPKIHKEITLAKKIIINLGDNKKKIIEKSGTQIVKTEDLLAWQNSATGPLFYLGNSVIHINDLAIQDAAGEKKIENISPLILIKVITVLAFMIPIIILIIINLIRIFRIWLYIAFAPLIALDIVFGSKIGSKYPDNNAFVMGNLIGMIFQPALVVGALSLAVIMIAGIQNSFINPNDDALEEARKEVGILDFGPESSSIKNPYTMDSMITIEWKEKMKDSGGPIGWFLLTFLSIMVIWALVKASFKFSKVAGKVGTKMMDFTTNVAKAVPVFGGGLSVGGLQYAGKQLQALPDNYIAAQTTRLDKKIDNIFGETIRDIKNPEYQKHNPDFSASYIDPKDNLAELKQLLNKQKITNGKDLEFAPNIAKLYKQLIKKALDRGETVNLFGRNNRFTESKLQKLVELKDDNFYKNPEVQELLNIIIRQK